MISSTTNPWQTCFTCVHQHLREKGSFPSVYHCAECQIQRNVDEDENIIDMLQHSPCTSTRRISACLRVLRMRVWRTLHTEGMYPHHIQRIQYLEPADTCSQLELCCWINSNPHMICNILFTDKAHFTCDGVNKTRNSHVWDRDNPHGTVKSNFQHLFAINVWCHWSVHFPATSDRWYLRQLFARWTSSTLRECSSTNTTTDILPAWHSTSLFQSGRQSVSES